MSLLRRLNEQAQQVKDAEAAQERGRSERKDRFMQVTVPAMQALGAFLTEITEQLKVVRPPVQQTFDLPGYGSFPTQCLFDFAVRVDPRYSEILVELNWKSRVDTEKAPRLVLNSFDRIRNLSELFKRMHLGGFKDEKRGPGGHVIACTLQASGFISSKMTVVASLEDDVARFTFENVDQLLTTRQSIPICVFSEEICERLGEFLLRDNDIFIREQWVRGLSAPAKPFRPANPDERAVAPLNAAPPIAGGPDAGTALNIESGFSRATLQRQDRDNTLLAELSEASRMAEEVVKRNIDTHSLSDYSEERSIGNVMSSSAGLADMHRQASAIPAHSIGPSPSAPAPKAAAAPPVALPEAPRAPPAAKPEAPRMPVANAVPPSVKAPTAPTPAPSTPPTRPVAASPSPAAPVAPRSAPAPVIARPAAAATPAAVNPPLSPAVRTAPATVAATLPSRPPAAVIPSTAARPPVPAAVAPRPPATTQPAAAARPPVAPPAPAPTTRPPAAATPSVQISPAPTAPKPESSEQQAQPAVARSFMDRFQKMRSELERKP